MKMFVRRRARMYLCVASVTGSKPHEIHIVRRRYALVRVMVELVGPHIDIGTIAVGAVTARLARPVRGKIE